ncbi:MAG: hypothetical protein ACP5H0_08135, partial [Caldisericum sp.]|uniref:hypothetical protein n=1 Tax=Caldisericum sp. TaxID=2499687 RepID=UPI003D14B83B
YSQNTPKNCKSEKRSDEDSPIKWRRDTLPELHLYDGDSSWLRHFGMTTILRGQQIAPSILPQN